MGCFSKPVTFSAGTLRSNLQVWKDLDLGAFSYNVIEQGANIELDSDIKPFHFENHKFS